ncbi:NAD(P)/FAD-dependent oxidoreductase [Bradymonadaceae bacterium TMQ3]|nr:NAD(P)/FAD-dependent oxidoreductase [Bradymonadaceae bacterium TMQ3]TXC75891.1 NAD(P)/FAD-dependent oxidoreductase [Bradymonadales bacterium TMQ1]
MATDDPQEAPLHLTIIGGGSAGCAAAMWAADHGARVTLVNDGLPLGGNALHVGVFPARLYMRAATLRHRAAHPTLPGLSGAALKVDLKALSAHVQECIERAHTSLVSALRRRRGLELIDGRASLASRSDAASSETLHVVVGKRSWRSDRVLLTCGATSQPPRIEGIEDAETWSLRDLIACTELPSSLIFAGIHDIGLTYAQAFARLGAEVTILHEEDRLLDADHSPALESRLLESLQAEGIRVVLDATVTHLERRKDQTRALGTHQGSPTHWSAARVVIVDHRRPSTEGLGLEALGVERDPGGFVRVDESFCTTHDAIFAAGDIIGRGTRTHAATRDAILAAQNAVMPSRTAGYTPTVPFVIHTDPPLAGVGWDEAQARQAGFDARCFTLDLREHPPGSFSDAPDGLIHLVSDRRSNQLLGARLLAPGAANAIMELAVALRSGLTLPELARLLHPPATLASAIAACARKLDADT